MMVLLLIWVQIGGAPSLAVAMTVKVVIVDIKHSWLK